MEKINIEEKLGLFSDHWLPHIICEVNGQHIRLVKFKGEFVWHKHDEADELFYVLQGTLRILFRDGEVTLNPGEMCKIPRGVEHLPVAEEEVHAMLFEPGGTVNTGNTPGQRTVSDPPWI